MQDGFDFVGFAFISKCQKISDQDFDSESLENCVKNGNGKKKINLPKLQHHKFFSWLPKVGLEMPQISFLQKNTLFRSLDGGEKEVRYKQTTKCHFNPSYARHICEFLVFHQKMNELEMIFSKVKNFNFISSFPFKKNQSFVENSTKIKYNYASNYFTMFFCCFFLWNEIK